MSLIRGAKAIVVDNDGFALIVRRSGTHPYVPLTNDLPGGKVETGETMVQGLIRELSEEIGFAPDESSISFISKTNVENYYGKDYDLELFEVKCTKRPSIHLSFEHDSYSWVKLSDFTIVGELYEPLVEQYVKLHS